MMFPTPPEGPSAVGEFGQKFREAREKKELSLDDVSNVTKISSRMLQAIEQEHFDQLPGGVFNKGFIRAYAKHLGLNSDEAVSDYLACLRQAQIDSHAGWDPNPGNGRAPAPQQKTHEAPIAKPVQKAFPPQPPQPPQPPHPPDQVELPELHLPRAEHIRGGKKEYLGGQRNAPPWALIGAAAVVVVLGIFLWTRHSRATNAPTAAKSITPSVTAPVTASAAAPAPAPSPTAASPTSAPAASVPSAATTAANPVTAPAPPQPTTSSSPTVPSPAAAVSQTTSAPSPDLQQSTDPDDLPVARRAKRASVPEPADPTQVKVEKKGDVTIRSFGATASKPAEKSAATLTLVIRASESSWISVTSDGQLLTQETLIAPAATSFHASRELVVRVGNAAGINFLWKGEELSSQGGEGEAKTFIFDAQGMRASAPPQPAAQN